MRLDQVGQDLGVGLGLEAVAAGDELVGQLDVVLDDAVVDQGQLPGAVRRGDGRWPRSGRPWVAHRVWPMPADGPAGRVSVALDQVVEGAGAVGRPHPPQAVAAVGPTRAKPAES